VRPLIAVPAGIGPAGKLSRIEVAFAGRRYLQAIERAGGVPVILSPFHDSDPAELLSHFNGLVLLGGPDVDPQFYGQDPHPTVYGVNAERDEFEIGLVRAAVENSVPTLAVCRGMQVANVALGGTLIQDLGDPAQGALLHSPLGFPAPQEGVMHEIAVDAGSRLAKALGSEHLLGASYHHQAIDQLGAGLEVVGRAPDGVVEAMEHQRGWFIGVQWHPEDTAEIDHAQQMLYDCLVANAS
jgi:putative glutamine amidotransferase